MKNPFCGWGMDIFWNHTIETLLGGVGGGALCWLFKRPRSMHLICHCWYSDNSLYMTYKYVSLIRVVFLQSH